MFETNKNYDEITFDQYFQGELKWQDEVRTKDCKTCHFSPRLHLKYDERVWKGALHENKSTFQHILYSIFNWRFSLSYNIF